MRKASGPPLARELQALLSLYATVLREMGRQAVSGHAWPPHRHSLAAARVRRNARRPVRAP
jgi:hypothetical protein